jgi:hypothetical protein
LGVGSTFTLRLPRRWTGTSVLADASRREDPPLATAARAGIYESDQHLET